MRLLHIPHILAGKFGMKGKPDKDRTGSRLGLRSPAASGKINARVSAVAYPGE